MEITSNIYSRKRGGTGTRSVHSIEGEVTRGARGRNMDAAGEHGGGWLIGRKKGIQWKSAADQIWDLLREECSQTHHHKVKILSGSSCGLSIGDKRSWTSGYHSSRKVRAHVSKCAFVGGLLSCLPACQTDMDMRLPRTFVDKRTYVFGRETSLMAFTLSLAWFTSICLA